MSKLKAKDTNRDDDPFYRDFRAFMWAVWRFLNLPEPTAAQYDIADFLQYGPRRRVILAFRGVGKSWITSAFVLWLLYRDKDHKVLVVSASKARADDFSTFCLRLLSEMPILKPLYPDDDQRCSKIAFDIRGAKPDHAPSVKSAGITGQIAGSRANTIVADDIEIPSNSDTQLQRDKLSESVKEFDAVLKPDGQVIFLGTPQTEMSLYNALPERGYVTRIWPARVPDNLEKYGTRLAPYVIEQMARGAQVGDSLDPKRFNDIDLTERELSYGRSGFSLQFQLDTSLSDADKYPLKLRDLIVMDLDIKKGPTEVIYASGRENAIDLPTVGLEGDRFHKPMIQPNEFEAYTGSFMYIDPSGRGKDETAWAVVNMLLGRLYLMTAGGLKGGYEENTLKHLLHTAKRYGVNRIQVEPNFGDGMFAKLLMSHSQTIYPVTIEDAEWSKSQKEARIIDTLEPVMNQHRLVVNKTLIEDDYMSTKSYGTEDQNRYRLFYQMTRLTKDRGALVADDRIEAVAGAVAYWLQHMARNTQIAVKHHRADLLKKELQRHVDHALGRKTPTGSPTIRGIKALKY